MYTLRAMENTLTAFCFITPTRDEAVKVSIALVGGFLFGGNAMEIMYRDPFTGEWVKLEGGVK